VCGAGRCGASIFIETGNIINVLRRVAQTPARSTSFSSLLTPPSLLTGPPILAPFPVFLHKGRPQGRSGLPGGEPDRLAHKSRGGCRQRVTGTGDPNCRRWHECRFSHLVALCWRPSAYRAGCLPTHQEQSVYQVHVPLPHLSEETAGKQKQKETTKIHTHCAV